MKTLTFWTIALAGLLSACGGQSTLSKKDRNERESTEDQPLPVDHLPEADAATESEGDGATAEDGFGLGGAELDAAIESGLEEVLDGATLDIQGSDTDGIKAVFEFEGIKLEGMAERSRTCTEKDGSAAVLIERSMSRDDSVDRARTGTHQVNRDFHLSRTWSMEGEEVSCAPNGKYALVPLRYFERGGLTLAVDYERSFDRKLEIDGKSLSRDFDVEGERRISWDTAEQGEGETVVTTTISSKFVRYMSFEKNGETKSIKTSGQTLDEQPLVLKVVRQQGLVIAPPTSVEIESGSVGAELPDGRRVVLHFDHVKREFHQPICARRSGEISGEVYEKGAAEPAKTFTIDLTGKTAKVVFADGTEKELGSVLCK